MASRFRDRVDAGQRLAAELQEYANRPDVIVLALPRGGVPVGYEIASALGVPLDILVVRKLGLPGQEELAMGAIGGNGVQVIDRNLIHAAHVSDADLERVIADEQVELARREKQYRGERPFPDLKGKTVILVDDGLATGASMRAAVESIRQKGAAHIVVAVPVAARETCAAFREITDAIICAETPDPFRAVGLWYDVFDQTSDDEVRELLERSRAGSPS
jgi:putative phosphoribosyl transferase